LRLETDYVLRLIEELAAAIRAALEKAGLKDAEEPDDLAGQAIGLALSMDPALASSLSPQSLVALLTLGDVDDRVVALVLQAIEIEAAALQHRGHLSAAQFRREQAAAIRPLAGG
jgi:hypothetical protein